MMGQDLVLELNLTMMENSQGGDLKFSLEKMCVELQF